MINTVSIHMNLLYLLLKKTIFIILRLHTACYSKGTLTFQKPILVITYFFLPFHRAVACRPQMIMQLRFTFPPLNSTLILSRKRVFDSLLCFDVILPSTPLNIGITCSNFFLSICLLTKFSPIMEMSGPMMIAYSFCLFHASLLQNK
mgnify:CR=1 FL=1